MAYFDSKLCENIWSAINKLSIILDDLRDIKIYHKILFYLIHFWHETIEVNSQYKNIGSLTM